MHFTDYDIRLAGYALVVNSDDEVLLSWFNGGDSGGRPLWTLPGGGVDYDETIEDGIVREVWEESGYRVALDRPLLTSSSISDRSHRSERPFKAVRVVYSAHVTGGELGTVEVGGSTDRAAWLPIAEIPTLEAHNPIIESALAARERLGR